MNIKTALIVYLMALTSSGSLVAATPTAVQHGNQPAAKHDLNADGVFSQTEFNAATAQRFAVLDSNRDGSISAPELAPVTRLTQRAARLQKFDLNRDQRISSAEWQQRGQTLFQRLDRNQDRVLDRGERASARRARAAAKHGGRCGRRHATFRSRFR